MHSFICIYHEEQGIHLATRRDLRQRTPIASAKEMRRRIFAMVWPATIESLLQMTVGMVSSAMLGRVGAIAIGSRLGTTHYYVSVGFFAAIGTGTTVMVARSIGAEDRQPPGVTPNKPSIWR